MSVIGRAVDKRINFTGTLNGVCPDLLLAAALLRTTELNHFSWLMIEAVMLEHRLMSRTFLLFFVVFGMTVSLRLVVIVHKMFIYSYLGL